MGGNGNNNNKSVGSGGKMTYVAKTFYAQKNYQ